jgi:hypothetical protein
MKKLDTYAICMDHFIIILFKKRGEMFGPLLRSTSLVCRFVHQVYYATVVSRDPEFLLRSLAAPVVGRGSRG